MRDWDKKREVMRSYNRSATAYDAQYAEEQDAKMEAALSHVVLMENSLVLDAGCGTGLLFEHIGEPVKLLVGLDISLRILKEAKNRVKRFPKATIVRADADFMPFPNRVFDRVFAITLLQNTPNPLLTLQEMERVGKRHSVMVVTGLKKEFSQNAFKRLLKEAGLEASIKKTDSRVKGYVAVIEV